MSAKLLAGETGPRGHADTMAGVWEGEARTDFEAARVLRIWDVLTGGDRDHGPRTALVSASDTGEIQRLSYSALLQRATDLSAGLARIGVRRGDRVAIWMTNSLEWVVSAFATMRLGATLVPVNTFLKPPEVRHFLRDSGARHLLMLDRFRKLDFVAMLTEISADFGDARSPGDLYSAELPDLRNVIVLNRTGVVCAGAFDLLALEAEGRSDGAAHVLADAIAAKTKPGDLAMVKYTSGSTGFPKGVMLEQGGIVANGVVHSRRMGADGADIYFSMMPFFHAGGSIYGMMTMLVNGGTLVFTEAYDAALGVTLAAREKATIVLGILATELAEAGEKLGIACPETRVASGLGDQFSPVFPNASFSFQAFGLTETYGPAAMWSPVDTNHREGSCGRVLPGYALRVVNPETGNDVAPGAVGEAWVRGNVMRGYWNNPDATARALVDGGWLRTEDLVTMDENGYLTWVGRLKLMLKVGGENVSLEEVERVAGNHEDIGEVGAVGVQDARKGEAVGLIVVRRAGSALDAAGLQDWLAARLAMFKRPRQVAFVERLPRLGNGKIDRVALNRLALDIFQ